GPRLLGPRQLATGEGVNLGVAGQPVQAVNQLGRVVADAGPQAQCRRLVDNYAHQAPSLGGGIDRHAAPSPRAFSRRGKPRPFHSAVPRAGQGGTYPPAAAGLTPDSPLGIWPLVVGV